MQNLSTAFAIKGAAVATPAVRNTLVAEMAVQQKAVVPLTPAAGAAAPASTILIKRNIKVTDIFTSPGTRIDTEWHVAVPPLRRSELKVPAAPTATPTDADVFEGADGKRYVLPRYALAIDKVGSVDEPRIAIVDRQGTPTLVVTLNETPSPAVAPGASELTHVIPVSLKYFVPSIEGGNILQDLTFPAVLLDPTETVVTAELPLTTPGQRQQILAALSSLTASAMVYVGRGITVGVPTGERLPDGTPGYRVQSILLNWPVQPGPIVLSDAQRNRLGGGASTVQPLIRHRITFTSAGTPPPPGKAHSYWQDPARPDHFYFLPDRFLLARAPDGKRAPLLRVSAVATTDDDKPRVAFEFQAKPVIDMDRIADAQPKLEAASRQRGGTSALALEVMPDPQPLLRLALPQDGAPSAALTERPGADIDLEAGLAHVETMGVLDFGLVYQALFGASLAMLRGEVRAAMSGGNSEDIPLELRIDKTVGDTLDIVPGASTPQGLSYRLTNAIESSVRIDRLGAVAVVGDRRIPLRIDQLPAARRLAPKESLDILLVAPEPLPAGGQAPILFDQSNVAVEVDPNAVWPLIFDQKIAGQWNRPVTVSAFPINFAGPTGSTDRVVAFNITVEHGGTVTLTETKLEAKTTVRVPLEPLINSPVPVPMPMIKYRTETIWGSGAIGVSDWRETPSTNLFAIKKGPLPDPPAVPPAAPGEAH